MCVCVCVCVCACVCVCVCVCDNLNKEKENLWMTLGGATSHQFPILLFMNHFGFIEPNISSATQLALDKPVLC